MKAVAQAEASLRDPAKRGNQRPSQRKLKVQPYDLPHGDSNDKVEGNEEESLEVVALACGMGVGQFCRATPSARSGLAVGDEDVDEEDGDKESNGLEVL